MYELLLLLVSIAFAIVAWRDLKLGIVLLAAILPSYLLRFSVGGIPSTLLEVFVLIIIFIWLVKTKGVGAITLPQPWRIALLLLLLASSVGVLVAPDLSTALGVWKAYFVEPMLLFLVIQSTIKTREEWEKVFTALGFCALIISILAIIQFVTGIGIPAPWDIERRVTSIFPYPNALGLFLGPIIVIGTLQIRRRRFWIPVVLFSFLAIILAQSEAAIAAVIVTLFFASLFSPRLRRWTITGAVIATIVVIAIPFSRSYLWQKATLQDFSGTVRRSQWSETVEMLKDRPLLGAGLSGYPSTLAPYHTHPEWEIFQYPHNIILNIWTELGVLGLIAFVWLAVLVIKKVFLPLTKGELEGVALIAFFALLEMILHGLVDVPYFKNDLAILTWILLATISISSVDERLQA